MNPGASAAKPAVAGSGRRMRCRGRTPCGPLAHWAALRAAPRTAAPGIATLGAAALGAASVLVVIVARAVALGGSLKSDDDLIATFQ